MFGGESGDARKKSNLEPVLLAPCLFLVQFSVRNGIQGLLYMIFPNVSKRAKFSSLAPSALAGHFLTS